MMKFLGALICCLAFILIAHAKNLDMPTHLPMGSPSFPYRDMTWSIELSTFCCQAIKDQLKSLMTLGISIGFKNPFKLEGEIAVNIKKNIMLTAAQQLP